MTSAPDRAEVLEEFALEAEANPQALKRYIERYPDLAIDLTDLARELMRPSASAPKPLSRAEADLVEDYWRRYSIGVSVAAPLQPEIATSPVLKGRSVSDIRDIAKKLGLPRQVLTALRQGRVLFATLPTQFLDMLAGAAGATAEAVRAELSVSAPLKPAGSFKADKKLSQPEQVPFEQILIEANVGEDLRRQLLGTD